MIQWQARIAAAALMAAGVVALVPMSADAVECDGFDISCDGSGGPEECTVCWPGPGGGIDIVCEEASRLEVRATMGDDCPIAPPAGPGLTIRQPAPGVTQPRVTAPPAFSN